MKVSQTQIQKLYQFTCKHFVEHYDVQTELVDHLANDIELQWIENSEQSFDFALNVAFKKFGVFGFQDVVAAREKALNKHYWKSVWTIYKQFFTLPKIISTVSVFCLTYLTLKYTPFFNYTLAAIIGAFVIVYLVRLVLLSKAIKRQQKESGLKWMYEDVINQLGGLAGSFGGLNLVFNRILDVENSFEGYKLIVLSVTIVAIGILTYVTLFVVPKKITLYLKQEYKSYYV